MDGREGLEVRVTYVLGSTVPFNSLWTACTALGPENRRGIWNVTFNNLLKKSSHPGTAGCCGSGLSVGRSSPDTALLMALGSTAGSADDDRLSRSAQSLADKSRLLTFWSTSSAGIPVY